MVRLLDQALRYLLILTMGTLTVTVFMQVLIRFVFKIPLPWTEEVARISFVYSVYLGAILGMRDRAHINVDIAPGGGASDCPSSMELVGRSWSPCSWSFMTWQGVVFVMANRHADDPCDAAALPVHLPRASRSAEH